MNIFNSENPIILNKFLYYLSNVKQYSVKTISEYRYDLLLFFRFIKKYCKLIPKISEFSSSILCNITNDEIIAFLVYLNVNRNCTAYSRRRKMCSIKAFYKWLFTFCQNMRMCNPAENLPSLQGIDTIPRYLTLNETKKIIDVFNIKNSKMPIRNNTIIALFLNCGLRVSELINIRLCDLNLSNRCFKVIGKGNKERICYLSNNMVNRLNTYINFRNKEKKIIDVYEPLFLSYRKGKLCSNTVEAITSQAYELAGIGYKGYTTHTLRHTAATIMYQNKPDILLLKEFLGHSSIKSTEIYTHVNSDKIKEAVNKNPLNNYIKEKIA